MRSVLFLLLNLLISVTLMAQKPENGEEKEYHENGKLRSVGKYKSYKKTGEWKSYYDNGQLESIGSYQNDYPVGQWKLYYRNGQLSGNGQYDKEGYPIPGTWQTHTESGQADSCNCPKPTPSQFLAVCQGVYNPEETETKGFGYKYQEYLWKMSCADPEKDSREIGEAKVRCMWNKYREEFRCYNFLTSIASTLNILKFSIESGFPGFISEMVKRYKVDVNFIDPGDGTTIMDYLVKRIARMKDSPPVDQPKIDEYRRIYDLLRSKGAKHANELK